MSRYGGGGKLTIRYKKIQNLRAICENYIMIEKIFRQNFREADVDVSLASIQGEIRSYRRRNKLEMGSKKLGNWSTTNASNYVFVFIP